LQKAPQALKNSFVASHDILSLYYLFEFIDKEKGILETHWIVTPKVESFGSERHRIRLRIQRAPQGSFLYLRVDLEERSNDPSLPGVPPWLPLGQDSEKEDALLQTLLNSANSTL
jgi:hypothetical protein